LNEQPTSQHADPAEAATAKSIQAYMGAIENFLASTSLYSMQVSSIGAPFFVPPQKSVVQLDPLGQVAPDAQY
jgi:hypothetical protein